MTPRPRGERERHVVHRRTATTPRPSALVHFCFLSSFSISYFCLPILPSVPSSPSSDLARALSPQEQGKSFWQTAASVEGGESCQGKGKKGEQGQEEEYETETTEEEKERGRGIVAPSCSDITSLNLSDCEPSRFLALWGSFSTKYPHFDVRPSLPLCLSLSSPTRLRPLHIWIQTHSCLPLSVPLQER